VPVETRALRRFLIDDDEHTRPCQSTDRWAIWIGVGEGNARIMRNFSSRREGQANDIRNGDAISGSRHRFGQGASPFALGNPSSSLLARTATGTFSLSIARGIEPDP